MKTYYFLFLILFSLNTFAQITPRPSSLQEQTGEGIEWLTMSEALDRHAEHPQSIVVFMRGVWCKCFEKVDSMYSASKKLTDYNRKKAYFVHFMAQSQDTIVFKNKTYYFVADTANKHGGVHELAVELSDEKITKNSPCFAFLDETLHKFPAINGRKTASSLQEVMKYFLEGYADKMNWQEFREKHIKQ